MAKRKKLSQQVEASVLLRSRRRCAICFGLNRDTSIKKGQIAHLDKNSLNDSEDNLVFLCFDHHDQFDSITSQSKNLTLNEVKAYRAELHQALDNILAAPASFHVLSLIDIHEISGHYFWEGPNSQAEIDIRVSSNGRIAASGIAFWGTQSPVGPNIGQIDFIELLEGDKLHHHDIDTGYGLELRFVDGGLVATEKYVSGVFGMNVSFGGEYRKAVTAREEIHSDSGLDFSVSLQDGNIFITTGMGEKQVTYTGNDRNPIILKNGKILFIRAVPGIGANKYLRNKIMLLDSDTLLESIVTERKTYSDGLDDTDEILRIGSLTVSTDEQHIYFVTEHAPTSSLLVKVNIESGKWDTLFSAEAFELIQNGKYAKLFLIARSEIGGNGRDIFYKICDEQGKIVKEFADEKSMIKFRNEVIDSSESNK